MAQITTQAQWQLYRDANHDEPITIMDPTDTIAEWLDRGDYVNVWRSVEIGTTRPDMFTPTDGNFETLAAPHWAYELYAVFNVNDVKASLIRFFQRSRVVKTWSDTPVGVKAAHRFDVDPDNADDLGLGYERVAPATGYRTALDYTVERIFLETPDDRIDMGDHDRALYVEYRTALVQWTCPINYGRK